MNQIKWVFEDFHQLNLDVLYKILQARAKVFVVEQRCNYLDPDGHDLVSVHLTGWSENELAAYARIIPPGIVYQEACIGRVSSERRIKPLGKMEILRMDHGCQE